jgi:two-component system sensor histidine kinase KdpD
MSKFDLLLPRFHAAPRHRLVPYLLAAAACAMTALLATPLTRMLAPANIDVLFLLAVFLVALWLGQGPALLAAFLGVALFDFFFVPPRLSLEVSDVQYLISLSAMLAVAILTGQLAGRLSLQAEESLSRVRRTRALYEMARDLAGAIAGVQVAESARRFLTGELKAGSALFLPDASGKLRDVDDTRALTEDMTLARRAYERGEPVELLGVSGAGQCAVYLPLPAPMRIRGVLEVTADAETLRRERALLNTVASLAAIAVERLHYEAVAQAAEVQVVSERLRSSVLSALSHDLRTPLTALVGLADTLALDRAGLSEAHRETAQALREQAMALSGMVSNLLDLARLSAGGLALRKDWQSLEEVVGAAIQLLGAALSAHKVTVDLPPDLPLLEFDAILLERVMGNLLDNAAKNTPPGTTITVSARVAGDQAEVSVCDQGPGFPAGRALTEPFVRGVTESAQAGVGLGLAICKAIVEAHGGVLALANPPGGGACARFTLPVATPPAIEDEAAA